MKKYENEKYKMKKYEIRKFKNKLSLKYRINISLLLIVIIACEYQPSICARLENEGFKVKLI